MSLELSYRRYYTYFHFTSLTFIKTSPSKLLFS